MSEKRYHVNDDNQVKKCSAKYRACKYSEDSSHFDNESDAIAEAERRLAKENKETAKPLKKKKVSKNHKNNVLLLFTKILDLQCVLHANTLRVAILTMLSALPLKR